ncbi:MAG: RluA family pseudouridine synthase [Candidatus Fermentibacter sp.]|nr:RluA family pseudouridine synthase [Candidatus Fermentibacter sp.]
MESGPCPYPGNTEPGDASARSSSGGIVIIADRDGIVAVSKPEGMASVPDRRGSPGDLHSMLQEILGARLYVVHRLDRPTSGVILFARTAPVHRALCMAFQSGGAAKTYHAVVLGHLEDRTISLPLRRFGSGRVWVDEARGKPCTTVVKVLEHGTGFTLAEARPHTGRLHQIRAHLAAVGHPVAGDTVYSKDSCVAWPRLMLHASRIEVQSSGGGAVFEAPLPEAFRFLLGRARTGAPGEE